MPSETCAMMDLSKIILGIVFLLAAYLYQLYTKISKNLPAPDFDIAEYWGKGQVANHKDDESIKPFKVSFGDGVSAHIT